MNHALTSQVAHHILTSEDKSFMKKIILVGGGGHCKSCIDVIENENKYKIIGIIDKKKNFLLNYKIFTQSYLNKKLVKNKIFYEKNYFDWWRRTLQVSN